MKRRNVLFLITMLLIVVMAMAFTACDQFEYLNGFKCGANHTWNNGEVVEQATCTKDGQMLYTCTVCGKTQTSKLDKLGHVVVVDGAVEQTCTTTGLTEGSHCSRCGEVFTAQQLIQALGHSWLVEITKYPSCDEKGVAHMTCARCDEEKDEDLDENGHHWTDIEATTSTCTVAGHASGRICDVCGLVEGCEALELAPHTPGEWIVDSQATCSIEGHKHLVCADCDAVMIEDEIIPCHTPTTVVDEAVEPTCTKTGLSEGSHCSACGEVLVAQQIIDAKGHAEVVDDAVSATCTTTGLTEGSHCSVCNEVLVAQQVVDALGHNTEGHVDHVDATCLTSGVVGGTYCSRCDEGKEVAQATIDALGHAWGAVSYSWGMDGEEYVCIATRVCAHDADHVETEKAYATSAILRPATCTADGELLLIATYKNNAFTTQTLSKVIEAQGHDEVIDSAVAPTCSATGLTEGSHCSVCGDILVAQVTVEKLAHTSVDDDAVEPTCTETGLTAGTHCSVCGEVLVAQQEIAAKGHTYVVDEAVEPTCTKAGLTAGSHCSECPTVFVEQKTVPATGHDYKNTVVAPTCEEQGYTLHVCANCGDDYKDTYVQATNHSGGTATCTEKAICDVCGNAYGATDSTNHNYVAVVTEPTCTKSGYTTHTCSRCGDTNVDTFVDAAGHEFGEWTVTTPATCEGKGVETRTCHCGHSETRSIDALGHDMSGVVAHVDATCTTDGVKGGTYCTRCGKGKAEAEEVLKAFGHTYVVDEAVAPTCTTTGKTAGSHCSICDTVFVEQIVLDKIAHSESEWIVDVEPTCSSAGSKHTECTVCGAKLNTAEITQLTHVYETVVTKPTCVDGGYTTYTCSLCGDTHTGDETSALDHDLITVPAVPATCLEDGHTAGSYCSRCDYKEDYETLPAHGHDFEHGAVVTKPATCAEQGYTIHVCAHCDATQVDYIAKLPHTWGTYVGENGTGATHTHVCTSDNCGHAVVEVGIDDCTWTSADVDEGVNVKYTCDVCGYAYKLPKHTNMQETIAVTPTCTTAGRKAYWTCNDEGCGKHFADALGHDEITNLDAWLAEGGDGYIKPNGHTVVVDEAVAPTCTETGKTEGSHCSVCGTILVAQETVAANGHTVVADAAVAPTCTETGLTAGSHCSVCNEVLVAQETVVALGHNSLGTVDHVDATCTEDGVVGGTYCTRCDNGKAAAEATIDALGHNTKGTVAHVDATCTTAGVVGGTYCTRCNDGKTAAEATIPAKGHTEVADAKVEPTCTTTGLTEGKHCSVCGAVTVAQNVVPAKGHSMSHVDAVPATCTKAGVKEYWHCTECGGDFEDEDGTTAIADLDTWKLAGGKLKALGHSYTNETVAPTCTEQGYTKHTCSRCGDTYNDTYVPAKGHNTDGTVEHKDATCTTAGVVGGTYCTRCDNGKEAAQATIPATGVHNWNDDENPKCTTCGLLSHSYQLVTSTDSLYVGMQFIIVSNANDMVAGDISNQVMGKDSIAFTEDKSAVSGNLPAGAIVLTLGQDNGKWVLMNSAGKKLGATAEKKLAWGSGTQTWTITIKEDGTAIIASTNTGYGKLYYNAGSPRFTTYKSTQTAVQIYAYSAVKCFGVHHDAKDATCTIAGNIEYWQCSVCGKKYSDANCTTAITGSVELSLAEHNYSTEWTIDTAATCTEAGSKSHHCANCDSKSDITPIPASGHSYSTEWTIDVEPTCTTAGSKSHHCTVCGDKSDVTAVDALGHTWNTATSVDDDKHTHTCSVCSTSETVAHTYDDGANDGTKIVYTCSDCGHQKFVDAHTHTYEWTADKTHHWEYCTVEGCTAIRNNAEHTSTPDAAKDPTCTDTGLTAGSHCSECGEILTQQTVVNALGHSMTAHKANAATCTEDGNSAYWSCDRCKKYFSDANGETEIEENEWVIAALGHETEHHVAKAATCQATGNYEYWYCSSCKVYYKDAAGTTAYGTNEWVIAIPTTTVTSTTTLNIATYATANGWNNQTQYTTVVILSDAISVVSSSDGANTGKYYNTSGNTWRIYGKENNAKLVFSAENGYTIVSITITYSENGKFEYDGKTYSSNDVISVDGKTSVEILAKTDKIFITSITVVYTTLAPKHNYGEWTTVTAATCEAAGEEKHVCVDCDKTETRVVAALGHNYSTEWTTDTPETCTTAGSKSHHCTNAGCDSKIDDTVIPATGHNFEDGVCTRCGISETTDADKVASVLENLTVSQDHDRNFSVDITDDIYHSTITWASSDTGIVSIDNETGLVTVNRSAEDKTITITATVTVGTKHDSKEFPLNIDKYTRTLAEFGALKDDPTMFYQIAGVVTAITDTTYGNLTISDGKTTLSLYGLASEKMKYNESTGKFINPQDFGTLSVAEGCTITIWATKGTYQGQAQAQGSGLVSAQPPTDEYIINRDVLPTMFASATKGKAPIDYVYTVNDEDFNLPTTSYANAIVEWTVDEDNTTAADCLCEDGEIIYSQSEEETTYIYLTCSIKLSEAGTPVDVNVKIVVNQKSSSGEDPQVSEWELVNSIQEGDEIVFTYTVNDTQYEMTGISNNKGSCAEVVDGTLKGKMIFIVHKDVDSYYFEYDGKYLTWSSSTNIKMGTTGNFYWGVSFDNNKKATITSTADATRVLMGNGSQQISSYSTKNTSGYYTLQIYKHNK